MELELRINGLIKSLEVAPNESLMAALRKEGYYSVKHGCETGECGACTVLVDDMPRPGCVTLAAQVGGCTLTTVESLGSARKLHPIQEAFVDTGAIQCGFCTAVPAMSNPYKLFYGLLLCCVVKRWHRLVSLALVRTSNRGILDAPR